MKRKIHDDILPSNKKIDLSKISGKAQILAIKYIAINFPDGIDKQNNIRARISNEEIKKRNLNTKIFFFENRNDSAMEELRNYLVGESYINNSDFPDRLNNMLEDALKDNNQAIIDKAGDINDKELLTMTAGLAQKINLKDRWLQLVYKIAGQSIN